MIVNNFSTGLNPNEVSYMRKIFGICDISYTSDFKNDFYKNVVILKT